MAGNPSAYQPGVAASFRSQVIAVAAQVQAQYPQAWAKAQRGGDDGEFIKRLGWACRQANIPCWLNLRRGDGPMSNDVLSFENATGARDRSGRLAGLEIIDWIIGHELPSAHIDLLDVTVFPDPATGVLQMPDGAAVEPTDLGGGGTVPGPNPTPGAGWEPKHSDLLARFQASSTPNRDTVRRIAEQFAFSFPGEGWGHKSSSPAHPPSDNVMARQTAGPLVGYVVIPRQANPLPIPLSGQHFIAVSPQNHLGVPNPGPTPTPTPGPTPPAGTVYPGDAFFNPASDAIFDNYEGRGEAVNRGMVAWIARIIWRVNNQGQTIEQAVETVIAEMPPVPR